MVDHAGTGPHDGSRKRVDAAEPPALQQEALSPKRVGASADILYRAGLDHAEGFQCLCKSGDVKRTDSFHQHVYAEGDSQ